MTGSLHPNKIAEALLNYAMLGSVSGDELRRFPRVLADAITSPLTRQTLALFQEDFEEHGNFDVDRAYLRANGSGGAVRTLLSNILEREFPPVEEILSAVKRVREAALEDVEVWKLGNLISADMPDEETYLDGLLSAAWVMVVGGLVKTRKTWILLQLALHLAAGVPFLGYNVTRKYRVLYIGGEGSLRTIRKRLKLAVGFIPGLQDADLDCIGIVASCGRIKLDTPAGEAWLQRVSEEYDIIIIDPYYRFLSVGSENLHEDQRTIQDVFDRLKAAGKAVVVAHHLRKPQSVDGGAAELRGAGLDAFADSILLLSRQKRTVAEGDRFTLKFVLRHTEEPDDLELEANGPLLKIAESLPPKVTAEDLIAAINGAGGGITGTALLRAAKDATEGSKHEIERVLAKGIKEKIIGWKKKEGRGQGRLYYVVPGATGEN